MSEEKKNGGKAAKVIPILQKAKPAADPREKIVSRLRVDPGTAPAGTKVDIHLYTRPPAGAVYEAVKCPQCHTPKVGMKSRADSTVYVCERCRAANCKKIPKENLAAPRRFKIVRTPDERVAPGFPFFALVFGRMFGLLLFNIEYRATDKAVGQRRLYAHLCLFWNHWIFEL